MRFCYFVPGLMGSTLRDAAHGLGVVWVNPTRLMLGAVGRLRLAPDGVSPGPPEGVDCWSDAVLSLFYQRCIDQLRSDLQPHDYAVLPWFYDWRLDVRTTGESLAADIRTRATADDPCSLVAHSLGGLLCRWAWKSLRASGQSNLVRRIVTLGTPHQGSYEVVYCWSINHSMVRQISVLSSLGAPLVSLGSVGELHGWWSPQQVATLTATWPAFYQCLPLIGGTDSEDDPWRDDLFEAGQWPAALGISQDHLNLAAGPWREFLLDQNEIPPSWVLTSVGSNGALAGTRLINRNLIGNPYGIERERAGDGVVSMLSATIPGAPVYVPNCDHNVMANVMAFNGFLSNLVLAERAPPPPPPPPPPAPVVVEGTPQLTLGSPPMGAEVGAIHDC